MGKYYQGKFTPKHPKKYVGDPTNIVFRSSWELNVLRWLDSTPDVLSYASEELVVPYYLPTDGRWHRYYPDFLVNVRAKNNTTQVWMVEVKPYAQTQDPSKKTYTSKRRQLRESMEYAKNQCKWQAAKAFCAGKNWKFVVLTERDLFRK